MSNISKIPTLVFTDYDTQQEELNAQTLGTQYSQNLADKKECDSTTDENGSDSAEKEEADEKMVHNASNPEIGNTRMSEIIEENGNESAESVILTVASAQDESSVKSLA
ncbi:unnamed protein product [Caenorhabditis bovis]|uniref:Uncharacterized protein n=1 Tax=Caenorhabditis bovis TaxID=2654633 RepID=A0A8S1FCU5_9PELO|nr:unnamed protein product [Caenorhabditis bovis]